MRAESGSAVGCVWKKLEHLWIFFSDFFVSLVEMISEEKTKEEMISEKYLER